MKLLGYTVVLKTTVGAYYKVEAGSYLSEEDIPGNAAVVDYSVEGLNEPTTSFVLSLSATSKAIYFYSITLSLFVPDSLDLDLARKDEDLVPAVPSQNGIPATNYEEKSADEYYAGIDFEESDAELEEDLSALVSTMTPSPMATTPKSCAIPTKASRSREPSTVSMTAISSAAPPTAPGTRNMSGPAPR